MSFPALQDLQGEVEYFFVTVESPQPSLILTFTPEILSTVISDLWPSTTYLVSLHVSNGAHNTSKTTVNVTTADGGTCVFYYYFWSKMDMLFFKMTVSACYLQSISSVHLKEVSRITYISSRLCVSQEMLNTSCREA